MSHTLRQSRCAAGSGIETHRNRSRRRSVLRRCGKCNNWPGDLNSKFRIPDSKFQIPNSRFQNWKIGGRGGRTTPLLPPPRPLATPPLAGGDLTLPPLLCKEGSLSAPVLICNTTNEANVNSKHLLSEFTPRRVACIKELTMDATYFIMPLGSLNGAN